jgi:hypothetical protein
MAKKKTRYEAKDKCGLGKIYVTQKSKHAEWHKVVAMDIKSFRLDYIEMAKWAFNMILTEEFEREREGLMS